MSTSTRSYSGAASAALLLSDLPTPSLLVDLRALSNRGDNAVAPFSKDHVDIPTLVFPHLGLTLEHDPEHDYSHENNGDPSAPRKNNRASIVDMSPFDAHTFKNEPAVGYVHCSVVRGRGRANTNEALSCFLAELDLPMASSSSSSTRIGSNDNRHMLEAKLVLGLNNHHVGSYYWARAAGGGSSMEAPGVLLQNENQLVWSSDNGFLECNSNDGKRSEWVNFLVPGDTVQLIPHAGSSFGHAIMNLKDAPIYGITSEGRPLGSEPAVICKWNRK